MAPKSKAFISELNSKKRPSAVNSNSKYSIATQLGVKHKVRKFSGNDSTAPNSQMPIGSGPSTPMNLTPRSDVKQPIFFQNQSSANSSELAHISQIIQGKATFGGELSPA